MVFIRRPNPSPLAGEGGARAEGVGGRGQFPTSKELLARAKWMRANPTDAEKALWRMLRAKRLSGYKFKRQVVIDWYIADFVNFEHRVILEADGSQHAESDYDNRRDGYLTSEGFRVLRFWNTDILLERQSIGDAIWHALQSPLHSAAARLPPSPARGEELGITHA